VSAGGPGAGGWSAEDDACWREAARLRREHPRWIVIWLASVREYRAYARMPGARRDTALTASTAEELNAKIIQAGQAPSAVAGQDDQQR
jgi:hypothetical protein